MEAIHVLSNLYRYTEEIKDLKFIDIEKQDTLVFFGGLKSKSETSIDLRTPILEANDFNS